MDLPIVDRLMDEFEHASEDKRHKVLAYMFDQLLRKKLPKYNRECVLDNRASFDLQWFMYGTRPFSHDDVNLFLVRWFHNLPDEDQKEHIGILGKTVREKIEFLEAHGVPVELFPCHVVKGTDRFI